VQILLSKKGMKLREILLNQPNKNKDTFIPSTSDDVINVLSEILVKPIKITDEKTARDRIQQWKKQEAQCENFQLSAESFNLLHLMSLVQVYEDLSRIGDKRWVIKFIRDGLKIGRKMEQRNRMGCDRLRKLFKEGITSEHLVRAGCRKSDFFVKEEDYKIFLSHIPSLEERSISPNDLLSSSRMVSNIDLNTHSKKPRKDTRVKFKLRLNDDDLRSIAVADQEDLMYIE
jgi:hypothetical protein